MRKKTCCLMELSSRYQISASLVSTSCHLTCLLIKTFTTLVVHSSINTTFHSVWSHGTIAVLTKTILKLELVQFARLLTLEISYSIQTISTTTNISGMKIQVNRSPAPTLYSRKTLTIHAYQFPKTLLINRKKNKKLLQLHQLKSLPQC